MNNACFSKENSTITLIMSFPSLKRNYWTNAGIRVVDVPIIEVARVVRPTHSEHVRAAVAAVEVIRTLAST